MNKSISGKRARTKAANRKEILDAAVDVFAERGFGATTVRDIIRRTNLASGTFYNYFSSKDEVFFALLDESALSVRPLLKEVSETSKTFEEYVERTFHTFFDYLVNDQMAFWVVRRNLSAKHIRLDQTDIVESFVQLRKDIEDGINTGMIPPVDPGYLSSAFIGVAFELGDQMLKRENPDPKKTADFATTLFLNGVKAFEQGASEDA